MNEIIGVKGDNKDRRRLIITRENKKKLQQYQKKINDDKLRQLEKEVKQLQYITLLKTLPIAFGGEVIKTVLSTPTYKQEKEYKKDLSEYIENTNVFSDNTERINKDKENVEVRKQTIKQELTNDEEKHLVLEKKKPEIEKVSTGVQEYHYNRQEVLETNPEIESLSDSLQKLSQQQFLEIKKELEEGSKEILTEKKVILDEKEKPLLPKYQVEIKKQKQDEIPIKKEVIDDYFEEKLERLKGHKIIDEYDRKLKDIRVDLRNLIFEYNTLLDDASQLYTSKEAEKLLNKLNEVIKKIEELKRKLEFPDMDKYDDNYLYILVSDYMREFKNGHLSEDIKDSQLYITISKKLEELDEKKDILSNKVENRKESLELDEKQFENIKEKYFDYQTFNDKLLRFQQEQEQILQDINEKIARSATTYERVVVQVKGMERQSKRLLRLMAMQMMLPGARSGKSLAAAALTYMYFMRRMMRPTTKTKRYKVVKVDDYQREIENSLSKLDDIASLLKKSAAQLEILIKEFKDEYQEYFGNLPECDQLLANLEKVKENLKEKEYEIEKIKLEQERNLNKNNEKVKLLTKEEEVI